MSNFTLGTLTKNQLKAASELPKLPDGQNLQFIIGQVGRGVRKGKGEHEGTEFPTLSMKVFPLEKEGDIESARKNLGVLYSIDVPCAELPEDKVSMAINNGRSLLRIAEVELPEYPTWSKDDKKWKDASGEFIDAATASSMKDAVAEAVASKIAELYLAIPEDAQGLLDEKQLPDHPLLANIAFYATTKHTGEYCNIQRVRNSLDLDGKPVVYGRIR
jgi:hypothetical protein